MNDALRDFINKFVIIYLDDIVIYSNSIEEYVEYLALVLEALEKYRLYTKPLKYIIRVSELEFYSYTVGGGRCRLTSTKV